jgi:histone acetyltransferase (RNA polymerase elongator complex component)
MNSAVDYAKDKWATENILVNSGVGARQYYTKLDYKNHGHYMARFLG